MYLENKTLIKRILLPFIIIVALVCAGLGGISASAATNLSSSPGASISYSYSSSAKAGTIRYISQNPDSDYYNTDYWGDWASQSKTECFTSSISMALSYLGINKTPEDLLDYFDGSTVFGYNWGGVSDYTDSYGSSAFSTAVSNYVNGNGKYSPPIIKLSAGYSSGSHFVVVAGKVSSTQYQIVDPYNDSVWTLTVSGSYFKYTKSGETYTESIGRVCQYYNDGSSSSAGLTAASGSSDPTLSGATYPTKPLKVGSGFSIKGKITSGLALSSVNVGVYNVAGKKLIGQIVTPGTKTYDISKLDSSITFGSLKPGIYYYRVLVKTSNGSTTLLKKKFTVLAKGKTVKEGTYIISPASSSSYAACVAGNSKTNKKTIYLVRNIATNKYKKFKFIYQSNGYYKIKCTGSKKYLTAASTGGSGTNVVQESAVSAARQLWQVLSDGSGYYYLVPKSAKKTALSLKSGTIFSKNNIIIKTADMSKSQRWSLS